MNDEAAEAAARLREAEGTKNRLLQIASEKSRRYRMQWIWTKQPIKKKLLFWHGESTGYR